MFKKSFVHSSWISIYFAFEYKNFQQLITVSLDKFKELYINSLKNGYNDYLIYDNTKYGYNIDNKIIRNQIKLNIHSTYTYISSNFSSNQINEDILKEYYSNKYVEINSNDIDRILCSNYVIVSCNNNSFTIIKHSGYYIILDPQSSSINILNKENTIDYILKKYNNNYLFITFLCGF
jgi:hypothetical protein